MSNKMGLQFEKLNIEDSNIYYTDETPNGDFSFKVRNREDDSVFFVEVLSNRKDLQVRQHQ